MVADATATDAFSGDQGIGGIEKDTGVYRTTFWGFGLEALPTPLDRETVLGAFLGWCRFGSKSFCIIGLRNLSFQLSSRLSFRSPRAQTPSSQLTFGFCHLI